MIKNLLKFKQLKQKRKNNFFFNDTAATEVYTLSLHDALPISVDTSVWYLYSKVAITEILGFNPEARFLVMLRNPVDMAWSLHSMFNFQGQEDHADFMTAWQLQEKRKKGLAIPSGLWLDQEMLLYKDVCSLGTQLKRVLNIVEKERVHVEIIDDLKTNPRNAYLRVLDFINIPDDGRATFPVQNSGRKIKNPALVKLLRTRTARKTAEMLKRILNLRTLGIGRPDLVMPPEIHKFLITEFKDEIVLLEDLIARDLISWRHWTRK